MTAGSTTSVLRTSSQLLKFLVARVSNFAGYRNDAFDQKEDSF